MLEETEGIAADLTWTGLHEPYLEEPIVRFDGEDVPTLSALAAQMKGRTPGEKVTLTVWRAGQTRKVAATLGSSD